MVMTNCSEKARQLKCTCCKDIGHMAEECPKDPNIRQAYDPDEEEDRLNQNMKLSKKLLADSQIVTIRMLSELARDKEAKLKGKDMMSFDDFQYNHINPHVLDIFEQNKQKKK